MESKHIQAEKDYVKGMKYKDLAEKYGVSINTIKSWKKRHGWERKKGAPKRKGVHTKKGGQPGNVNACLAIPVIGGLFVISNGYSPLMVMLILHIITLVLSKRDQGPMIGSIIGIVTSCLAWIPILGFILHIITALALIVTALVPDEKTRQNTSY